MQEFLDVRHTGSNAVPGQRPPPHIRMQDGAPVAVTDPRGDPALVERTISRSIRLRHPCMDIDALWSRHRRCFLQDRATMTAQTLGEQWRMASFRIRCTGFTVEVGYSTLSRNNVCYTFPCRRTGAADRTLAPVESYTDIGYGVTQSQTHLLYKACETCALLFLHIDSANTCLLKRSVSRTL